MNKNLIALLFIMLVYPIYGQFTANVDSVYSFMKYNSIHHKRVNWKQEDIVFRTNVANAKTLEDTLQSFVQVLEVLGDVHSHFTYNQRYLSYWQPVPDSVMKRVGPMLEMANAMTNKPVVELIQDKFLYMRIPGYQVWDPQLIQEYTQSLYDSIVCYDPKKLKGVVVDLRWNTGGNAYPMLGGLSCLLDGAVVAYQTDMNNEITDEWRILDGNLTLSGTSVVKVHGKAPKAWSKIPVVVLTGPITNSSGSLVAIAFKGRPCTTSMGEPTAVGYTTCNGYFWFNDQLSFNFAVSHFADRDKTIYPDNVSPSQEIRVASEMLDLESDKLILEALVFLEKKGTHAEKKK
ncbi:MAG: S41 family peptidase [Flavobacteriales bacterium]